MSHSLRDAPTSVIDGQESPAEEPAVVRPVFVDVREHRRVWTRVSAAALAVLCIAFIAGAGLLLSERPLTAFPRLIGISEPENDESVAGNGTASDAPDGVGTTAAPGQPGRLPVPGAPVSSAARPGALPGPSTPPGIFGQPVSPVVPSGPQGGVGTPGAGTPAPGDPVTPRIDLPTDPAPPVVSDPPVEPPAPPVEPPAPPADPPVEPPVEPPPVEPPVEPPPVELPLTVVSVPALLDPIIGPRNE